MIRLLNLALPFSKNRMYRPLVCGRYAQMVRTRESKLRGLLIINQIWQQLGGRLREPSITKPCSLVWSITFPDRRKRDRHNYMEHLADILQEAKVVADDSLIVHEVGEVMPVFSRPGFVDLTIQELPQ
jgi:Holliday junction resolvase RusA-like endonuclease